MNIYWVTCTQSPTNSTNVLLTLTIETKSEHTKQQRKLDLINFGNIENSDLGKIMFCYMKKTNFLLLFRESFTQKTATVFDNSFVKITLGLQQFFNFVTQFPSF